MVVSVAVTPAAECSTPTASEASVRTTAAAEPSANDEESPGQRR